MKSGEKSSKLDEKSYIGGLHIVRKQSKTSWTSGDQMMSQL